MVSGLISFFNRASSPMDKLLMFKILAKEGANTIRQYSVQIGTENKQYKINIPVIMNATETELTFDPFTLPIIYSKINILLIKLL
jgi:hypothetical protein